MMESDPGERPVFQHPQWMLGVVLIFAVVAILAWPTYNFELLGIFGMVGSMATVAGYMSTYRSE